MKLPILLFFLLLVVVSFGQDSLKIDKLAALANDSLLGTTVPDLQLTDIDGVTHNLADYRGSVIYLNFWFVGCPPCMGEIPDINRFYTTFKDSSFLLISLALNDSMQLRKFLAGKYLHPPEPVLYPIVPNAKAISSQLAVTGYPTSLFIDKKGIIRLVASGGTGATFKRYLEIYGKKGLSRGWRRLAKQLKDSNDPSVYDYYSPMILELLREH